MQSTELAKRPLQGSASWRPPDTGTRSRPRVLLVDDDEDTREMYAWCLRAAGWIVETASDGAEALLVASAFEPNVIVMDVRPPSVDGLEATRWLKASDLTKEIPVVACSGCDWPWADSLARRAGCEEFVAKPCAPEELRALLEDLVKRPRTTGR
jgi:CheY-like chemotaxis protein